MTRALYRCLAIAGLCVLLAGCGESGENETLVGAELDGLTADRLALAATAAGTGAVVVEGGAAPEGPDSDGSPRPVLWWVPPDGAPPQRHPLPIDQALLDVSTWWTGEDVVVVGLPCPSWSVASEPPDLVDDGAPFTADLCGGDRYLFGTWNPDREEWRELPGIELSARGGLHLEDVDRTRALLRSVEVIDGAPERRSTTLRLVDVSSGAIDDVPAPLDSGSDPDASFTSCIHGEDVGGLLVWETEEPPALDDLGGGRDELVAVEAEPLPGRSQHLLALGVEDGSWIPRAASGSSSGAAVSPVCAPGGVLVSSDTEASLVTTGDAPRWRSLGDLPQGGLATRVAAQEGRGAPLAIAPQDPARTGSPDAPQMSPLWVLVGAEWKRVADVPHVEGWRGVVAEETVISLLPERGTTAQGGVRVVAEVGGRAE